MEHIDNILNLKATYISTETIKNELSRMFAQIKKSNGGSKYLMVMYANELTRNIDIISDCGLQKDIRKRIAEGHLSFNKSWTDIVYKKEQDEFGLEVHKNTEEYKNLYSQVKTVFGNHRVDSFFLFFVKCDINDWIVVLETLDRKCNNFVLHEEGGRRLPALAEKVYIALLKEKNKKTMNDWEKVVHEISSPLDFIYSNSDFLSRYLTNSDVDEDLKQKKLQDFKMISSMLINRVHQFRFAFAGLKELNLKTEYVDLYNIIMPITHLWYHDAQYKKITFNYDEVRNLQHVKTDREVLQFILFNLTSNAIKYANYNTVVKFSAKVEDSIYSIDVRDSGVVIDDSEREKIWQMGYRTSAAKQQDARGMGIGLNVSRQLAREIKGSIFLVENTGADVVFRLSARELF